MRIKALPLFLILFSGQSRAYSAEPIQISFEEARHSLIGPVPVVRTTDAGRFAFSAVQIKFVIEVNGRVRSAEVAPPSRLETNVSSFASRALAAVKGLTFRPILRDGVAVEAQTDEYVRILPPEKVPAVRFPFPEVHDLSSVEFFLKRSGCFGSCPSYEVRIAGDGVVTYSGETYVAVEGKHTDRVTVEEVRELLDAFRKADFYSLDDKYSLNITDGPTFVVGIKIGDAVKSVTDYFGEQAGMLLAVGALEKELDEAAETFKWLIGNGGTVPSLRREGFDLKSKAAGLILTRVAASGDETVVRDLVNAGAPVGVSDLVDVTALSNAARSGNLTSVNLLIEHGANAKNARVLMEAVLSGSPSVVSRILEAGADAKADLPGIRLLLFSAASWRGGRGVDVDRGRVVRLLVKAGADPNVRDADGNIPLHGDLDEQAARALINLGANVNAQNKRGETPLMRTFSDTVAKILLDAGADVSIRSNAGKTALDFARERQLTEIAALIEKVAGSQK